MSSTGTDYVVDRLLRESLSKVCKQQPLIQLLWISKHLEEIIEEERENCKKQWIKKLERIKNVGDFGEQYAEQRAETEAAFLKRFSE